RDDGAARDAQDRGVGPGGHHAEQDETREPAPYCGEERRDHHGVEGQEGAELVRLPDRSYRAPTPAVPAVEDGARGLGQKPEGDGPGEAPAVAFPARHRERDEVDAEG